jgi:hypothetical protein
MRKKFLLLSISATLLFSLSIFGVSHAIQVDMKKQTQMKGTAHTRTTQISTTSRSCGGRDGAACKKYRSMLR